MKSIFQFENHESAASNFRNKHLEPRLKQTGQFDETQVIFQDYLDRKSPGAPPFHPKTTAAQAYARWNAIHPIPDKTAWIFDLDATGGNSPNSSYGLCVMLNLIEHNFSLTVPKFLEYSNFVTVIFTLYPDHLREKDGVARLKAPTCDLKALDNAWPQIYQITRPLGGKNQIEAVAQSLENVVHSGPRVILANARTDNAWLSEIVVSWLKV